MLLLIDLMPGMLLTTMLLYGFVKPLHFLVGEALSLRALCAINGEFVIH